MQEKSLTPQGIVQVLIQKPWASIKVRAHSDGEDCQRCRFSGVAGDLFEGLLQAQFGEVCFRAGVLEAKVESSLFRFGGELVSCGATDFYK